MTHPFHPWHGREFELVAYRVNWGQPRVDFYDDRGVLVVVFYEEDAHGDHGGRAVCK